MTRSYPNSEAFFWIAFKLYQELSMPLSAAASLPLNSSFPFTFNTQLLGN
ncbi:MAG: hypothetical protein ABI180_13965 [Microcoleus sp.]